MKIAVLGNTGFVGKNLINSYKDFDLILPTLRNSDWANGLNDADIFINLVGKAHDHKGIANEQDYFFANFELVKEIYNSFLSSQAKVLIHISSIAALEEFQSDYSLKENDICRPYSWYGKSKRAAEEWLTDQDLPVDKKVIILRPPMIHGAGDKGNLGLLHKFISKGLPYPLSSFNNHRSFISMDNFLFFINSIIKNVDRIKTGIYHIADDETISTNEIIDIIKIIENKKIHNLYFPKPFINIIARVGDFIPLPINSARLKKMTGNLVVSNQKIKEELGITKLPLTAEEGIRITIKNFKKC